MSLVRGCNRAAAVCSAIAGVAITLAACSGSGTTGASGDIVIGVPSSFTGPHAGFGQSLANGAQAAALEINRAGGILGRHLRIVTGDTVGDPADAVPTLDKMLGVDHVMALVGPGSGTIFAQQPLFDQANIPDMTMAGVTALDNNSDPMLWRPTPSDSQLGVAMGVYGAKRGYKTAAVVFSTEASSQELRPVVAKTFSRLGGKVVATVNVEQDQSSYRSEAARIVAAHPDVIFMQTDPLTAAPLFTDLQQAGGATIPVIGTDITAGSDYIKAIGASVASKVLVSIQGGSEAGGGGPVFTKYYQEIFHEAPISNANFAYDATIVLALAMDSAGNTNGQAIASHIISVCNPPGIKVSSYASALALLKAKKKINYDGASGPMDFNAHHNVFGPYDAVRVGADGQEHIVATLQPQDLAKVTG